MHIEPLHDDSNTLHLSIICTCYPPGMETDGAVLDFLEVLYRVNRLIVDDARQHIAGIADLDVSEFMVLRAASRGAVSPAELTRRLSTHPTSTSRTITHLVRAGLLQRSSAVTDARRLVVSLTDEGRRITDLIARRIRPELQRRFDAIGQDRVTELLDTLHVFLGDDPLDPSEE
ncbi:MarR family winged helix-turn-helix transcriptional regulator [Actinoallomurus rhizosphaericola]|uniref:MarR family winged helix-turn-helix transcriptional regulator n=1 Tax=Actinoallomurus rhizosphaericola TaxID=2952536 RepID=UPI002091C2A9|nr:MarR family transcriptional regulator [Actinoallomurus rhizosphaericola]MCO5993954.1 MarR family transcriptional regulator [Actinoallomurus rhizosphaericola]